MPKPILELRDLHVYIGPFYVVQGVSLTIERGECLALIGRNGAGKTTLIKGILGITGPVKGSILFDGVEISGLKPYERSRLGIGYIPDTKRIFPNITVEENLILASLRDGGPHWDRLELVYNLIPDLKRLRRLKAGALSGGQQQMLNIGRALMQPRNKLILVDEPTEGLSPLYVARVRDALKQLLDEGVSLLLVEGRPTLLKSLANRFAIMSSGRIVAEGPIEELDARPDIVRRYVGVTF